MKSMVLDGVVVAVMSACAAALVVIGLTIVLGAGSRRKHGRAPPRKRAIAMVVLALVYVALRMVS